MDFSKMRHRIIFLKSDNVDRNSMNESVALWHPWHPVRLETSDALTVTVDNRIEWKSGVLKSVNELDKEWAVWAYVAPKTGREYDEAQKLRAETTYNIVTRYFSGITTDMKILYGLRVFKIESVLNIDEKNEQLQVVVSEVDANGKENG